MSCLNPIDVWSPETRWLKKCRKEGRSFEFYVYQANQRRNVIYDPVLLIDNPRDYYDNHFRPDYRKMKVPCGRCDACIKTKVQELFVRSYFEYIRTLDAKRGSVWLGTLTYADEILPRSANGTPCFNRRHVQLFFKRLRKRSNLIFKVFYVCEYGGEFGRPHYHFLLFVESFLSTDSNKFQLLQWIAESWTKIDDRNARFNSMNYLGLFDMQRVDIRPVKDFNGLRYVCKYIAKQEDDPDFNKLDLEPEQLPFHYASIGFGDCLVDYCNVDVWKKGFIEIDGFNYPIPSYYKLKMQREYFCTFENGNIVYKPSSEGLFYQRDFCLRQIEECKDLARLNDGFPVPPDWVFDPCALESLKDLFDRRILDPDFTDPLFEEFFEEWRNYLSIVQTYNKSCLDAQIQHWHDQRRDHYLKKTFRK